VQIFEFHFLCWTPLSQGPFKENLSNRVDTYLFNKFITTIRLKAKIEYLFTETSSIKLKHKFLSVILEFSNWFCWGKKRTNTIACSGFFWSILIIDSLDFEFLAAESIHTYLRVFLQVSNRIKIIIKIFLKKKKTIPKGG